MVWHSKTSMRTLFFLGAMTAFFGLGAIMMDFTLPGAILLCLGAGIVVIGMTGLTTHMKVEMNRSRKR
ncbi:MAG: hypothetical protein PHX75_00235 [Candidatus Methanomethylophilaceae archaeon]|nr:hypothetical protein [Candidatus Methanomethylophilaceae archaeon]